jgi:hypothetical protein
VLWSIKTTRRVEAATTAVIQYEPSPPPISEEEVEAEESRAEGEEYVNCKSGLDEGGSLAGSTETNYADDADYEGPPYLGAGIFCTIVFQAKTDRSREPL